MSRKEYVMENTIITKTDKQFGTVRYIEENKTVLYCASDVAKALGYTNPRKAIIDHCRGVTKRDTLTNGGLQPVNFIPECDVYRLICHSKLPDAVRFEKWVFEDIVPKAVRGKQTEPVPEQLTLETAEYHYYDKTYNGQPVISLADFVHLTGVPKHRAYGILMRLGSDGKHYFRLDGASLAAFKQQNPSFPKAAVRWFIVVTKAGFELLMKEFGSKADVPQCFIEEKRICTVKKEEYVLINDNENIKEMISELKEKSVAINSIIDFVSRYNTRVEEYAAMMKSANVISREFHALLFELSTTVPKTNTNCWS